MGTDCTSSDGQVHAFHDISWSSAIEFFHLDMVNTFWGKPLILFTKLGEKKFGKSNKICGWYVDYSFYILHFRTLQVSNGQDIDV